MNKTNRELQHIIQLAKTGKLNEARLMLRTRLEHNPLDERAWYLLALFAASNQKKFLYYQQCLKTNPNNQRAIDKLQTLLDFKENEFQKQSFEKSPLLHNDLSASGEKKQQKPSTQLDPQKEEKIDPEKINSKKHPTFFRVLRYLLLRILTIFLTIFLGIFLTVMIVNRTGQIDQNVETEISNFVNRIAWSDEWAEMTSEEKAIARETMIAEKTEAIGLNLPFLPRHLRWTLRSMTFEWGELNYSNFASRFPVSDQSDMILDLILKAFPNTLLLMGTAYLLVFIIGLPLALYLSQHHGTWLDKLFTFLSPLSSIPSWVHGILLIFLVAVPMKWLPISGMYDLTPPEIELGYLLVIGRHMILPVLAIVLALIFNLVYTWRTYFLIYSEEDYVELGRAKGLPNRQLHKKYVLRPGLPYVITSFALTLVSFWQTMTALEVVFNWPGIGLGYVKSLPHFFGEGMYPGELLVSIAIVVIFAYLLGIIVFLLDIIYIIVDPRIRLGNQEQVKIKIKFRKTRKKVRYKNIPSINNKKKTGFSSNPFHSSVKKTSKKFKEFWREIIKYPSAIFGFSILLLFIIGSITALVAYPYREAGQDWYTSSITGKPRTPRLANPVWVNLFRTEDLPITITFNTSEDDCEKEVLRHPDKNDEIIITCEFDYPYGDIPQNIYIYYTAEYDVKTPFTEITWITPSDDEIRLNSVAITSGETYRFSENIPLRKLLILNKNWNDWFVQSGVNTTFPLWMLFVESESTEQVVQNGVYQIRIDTLLFEENNNLDAEIIIFGQAHGLAGTDFMRRDLMFPLLWGMPFVIFFGLFGSILTTVLALVVSALGVWYGGWVDALIQRITEANMILPILAISILIHVIYRVDMMIIIGGVILMNVFGAPTKTFRAAFLQVKESPYIEAAQIYGASNWQLITRYMIPRILPVIVPQLVMLIPGFIFLEATFGMFNIKSNYPTWGRIIYEALKNGAAYGSRYWVLEPLFLLLLTGFAFTMLGSALDKVLNPKLKK